MIPESDVPSQTRRLHPVIYGWQQTAHAEEGAGRTLREAPRPTSDECQTVQADEALGRTPTEAPRPTSNECQASPSRKKGDNSAIKPGEPGADAMPAKPKKKIVPTLVSPGHRAQGDVAPVPSTAVPPSPTLPSAERKKRRITPTLVHAANVAEDGRTMPGTEGSVSSRPTPAVGEEAPLNALSATTDASGSGLDQTPKKRRMAPTLVSAL